MNTANLSAATVEVQDPTGTKKSYLSSVQIVDVTDFVPLDYVDGRHKVWQFTTYQIQYQYAVSPGEVPMGVLDSARNLTIKGEVYSGCYPIGGRIETVKDPDGAFRLNETLSYLWFKQDPTGCP